MAEVMNTSELVGIILNYYLYDKSRRELSRLMLVNRIWFHEVVRLLYSEYEFSVVSLTKLFHCLDGVSFPIINGFRNMLQLLAVPSKKCEALISNLCAAAANNNQKLAEKTLAEVLQTWGVKKKDIGPLVTRLVQTLATACVGRHQFYRRQVHRLSIPKETRLSSPPPQSTSNVHRMIRQLPCLQELVLGRAVMPNDLIKNLPKTLSKLTFHDHFDPGHSAWKKKLDGYPVVGKRLGPILARFASHCVNITALRIVTERLTSLQYDYLSEAIDEMSHLTRLSIEVRYIDPNDTNPVALNNVFDKQLSQLKLVNVRVFDHVAPTDEEQAAAKVTDVTLVTWYQPQHLERLLRRFQGTRNIGMKFWCPDGIIQDSRVFFDTFLPLSNLTHFSILLVRIPMRNGNNGLAKIATRSPALRTFRLAVFETAGENVHNEHLVGDRDLERFAQHVTALQTLTLIGVGPPTVRRNSLLRHCPSLTDCYINLLPLNIPRIHSLPSALKDWLAGYRI